MNRLRMEHRAGLSAAEREIERIEARRPEDDRGDRWTAWRRGVKDRVERDAQEREELQATARSRRRAAAAAAPGDGRTCTARRSTALAEALEHPETRTRSRGGASRPHRRHRPDAGRGRWSRSRCIGRADRRHRGAHRAPDRAERESGRDAGGGPKCEEVARNRRPLAAS